jgi:hypothetical protein
MHRFLFAHEADLVESKGEAPIDKGVVKRLAEGLVRIRAGAPEEMRVSEGAESYVSARKALARDARPPIAALGGFWRRYPGLLLKVGNAFALSAGRGEISILDVQLADELLGGKLYRPLEGIIKRVAAGPKKRALYRAVDDVEEARESGVGIEGSMGSSR